jgi:hypothetical protein
MEAHVIDMTGKGVDHVRVPTMRRLFSLRRNAILAVSTWLRGYRDSVHLAMVCVGASFLPEAHHGCADHVVTRRIAHEYIFRGTRAYCSKFVESYPIMNAV